MRLLKYVGIDIGRSSISCCVLKEEPDELKDFAERYKPIVLQPTASGVKRLLSLGDVFFLEPTGADYWFWVDALDQANAEHYFVSGVRIRSFAKSHDILNKGDREDAAVIACYGMINHQKGKSSAFLKLPRTQLKELWLTLRTMPKTSTLLQNKIKARLAFENPNQARIKPTDRVWGSEAPPKLWRDVAGISTGKGGGRKRADETADPVGRGVSWVTRELAAMLCNHESFQGRIEREIEQELDRDKSLSMRTFQAVFEVWGISDRPGVAILSACHPLDQFLGEEGRRVRKRKWNAKGTVRSGRDKSLKAFQRAMAFGQVKVQSGQKMVQVPTGDRYVRDALINYLSAVIVMRRQPNVPSLHKLYGKPEEWESWSEAQKEDWKQRHSFAAIHADLGAEPWNNAAAIASVMKYNGTTEPLARLQLFYQFAPQCQNLRKFKRVKKVYSKFIRMLFKDLVNQYQTLKREAELNKL